MPYDPSLVNAVLDWATQCNAPTQAARLAALTAERDALISGEIISGGQPSSFLTQASQNGKFFQAVANLSQTDKLSLLGEVLRALTAASDPVTFVDFSRAF
jgi:hypothetical protein